MTIPHHSTTRAALDKLINQGVSRSDAADSLGLTPSAVTQALGSAPASTDTNPLDDQYDRIEKKLLDQLERTAPLLMKPGEISRVLQTINSAKRRGGPLKTDNEIPRVLQLHLPVAIQNRFVVNSTNQVVSAGSQDLVTLPSANVAKLLEGSKNVPVLSANQATDDQRQGTSGGSSVASDSV